MNSAIDFEEMAELEAREFPAAFARIVEQVKPLRDRQSGQIHQDCFWKYWDMRPRLRDYQSTDKHYLVSPSTTKYVFFRRYRGRAIFSQKVKVVFIEDFAGFSVLQSSIHNEWVRSTSGSRGSASVEYSLGKSFGTFPFPNCSSAEIETNGSKFYLTRERISSDLGVGPTQIYNMMHNASCVSPEIVSLRILQEEMDRAVAIAYGWNDINLDHAYYEVPYLPESDRIRFTISEGARLEILLRLTELNRQCYQVEIDQDRDGQALGATKSRMRRTSSKSASELTLDLDDDIPKIVKGTMDNG